MSENAVISSIYQRVCLRSTETNGLQCWNYGCLELLTAPWHALLPMDIVPMEYRYSSYGI